MLSKANILKDKVLQAKELYKACILCGHKCGVDRTKGEKGKCDAGTEIVLSSYTAHHGEEPFISGSRGSGAIFFSYCNLKCVFCQNHEISQGHLGKKVTAEELACIMIELQDKGCHNINLVSPTHFMPGILEALYIAHEKGLTLPVVYNTNGYDSIELLKILESVVNIYMPDLKYFESNLAKKYSNAANYPDVAKKAIRKMHEQVGEIEVDEDDVALEGLLVRHLVLPGHIDDSKNVIKYLSTVSKELWISIMAQYSPQFKACEYPEIDRKLTAEEYWEVILAAQEAGLENYLMQELESSDVLLPDFKNEEPFSG